MKRFNISYEKRRILEGYVFILPGIIGFLLFFAFPLFTSIRLSFSTITKLGGFKMEWVGMANYLRAFLRDVNFIPLFISTVSGTLRDAPIITVFSLFLAILLNRKIRFKGFFRGVFFLPVLLGSGYVMQQLLGQQAVSQVVSGNTLAQLTAGAAVSSPGIAVSDEVTRGITVAEELIVYLGPQLLSAVQGFLNSLTLSLWRCGVQVVLFLAGMQGIPISLYESVKCDGATEWDMFWKITLPMLSPVILLVVVFTIIDSFTYADNPMVRYFTSMNMATVAQFGYSAAMAWIYFGFIFAMILLVFGIMQRFTFNSGVK